jgi:hypothetical protein
VFPIFSLFSTPEWVIFRIYMREFMIKNIAFLSLLILSGCYSMSSEEDDLRTVPITNNPYVIPNHGGGLPGVSSAGAGSPR